MTRSESIPGPRHQVYAMWCIPCDTYVPWDEDTFTYRCPHCRRRMTLLPVV